MIKLRCNETIITLIENLIAKDLDPDPCWFLNRIRIITFPKTGSATLVLPEGAVVAGNPGFT